MAVVQCKFCHECLVEWMSTKFGKRMPFEFDLVAQDSLPEGTIGWIPGRWQVGKTVNALVMAPVHHYSDNIRKAARKVAVVHRCPQYIAATSRDRDLVVA